MRYGLDCRLPTYRMGGISQYILHLIPAMAALDQSNLFDLFHSWKESSSFVPHGANNFSRRVLYTPCHHRWERWTLAAELIPRNLDVFHSPDFIPPIWGARRLVITIHDLNFIYYPQYLTEESKRYYLDQVQWAADKADFIIADSHSTRQDILENLHTPAEKVQTIHLASNPLYEQPVAHEAIHATLKKYNLPKGFILFVGTLEPRKNLPMLIRAYALIREESNIDIPLVLIGGKGWIYDEIFSTIEELNLSPFVHHLSGVEDKELAHLYYAAGVHVTPSHYEGFGLPALEAQHCGCPVIVSDRGSLPEIVGPYGVTLDPDDIEIWASTITSVLQDSVLRETMIRNGRQQAKSFTWKKTAEETLAVYKGIN